LVDLAPILKDRYETIVIGTGIGGLAAAAVLAHEGLDVLVVERAGAPGGCCSSFRVADFTFETASSILQGFGEVGFHVQRTLFDYLRQQVDLIPRDSAYVLHFGDKRVEFHRDRHAFTAELGALFPQQAGSLLAFMRELEHIYQAYLDCGGPPRHRSDEATSVRAGLTARHPASVMRLSKYSKMSAERVFNKHSDDPLARAFFDADMHFSTGYRLADLSSPMAALAMIDRHVGGTHHAIGSAQQIPDRLEKSITARGGRIAYRTHVESVIVEGEQATGVVLAGGRRILADLVIANTSARQLLADMVPKESLGPQAAAWLDSLVPARSVFSIYLGVEEDSLGENFHPSTVVVDDEREPGRYISISVPSLFDPYLSPEGYQSVTIHAVTDPDAWPSAGDDGYGSQEYEDHKQQEAAAVLERLKGVLPDVAAKPVIWRIASPTTFERVIARERGMLAAPYPKGSLAPASLSSAVTGVRGLFLAGDSTVYGRGVAQAAASTPLPPLCATSRYAPPGSRRTARAS
jgi:phytoene dehydrogenase-like protein